MDTAQQNILSSVQSDDILESKLQSFLKNLQDLGLSDEEAKTLLMSITTTATKQTMAKVSALMNDEEFENWKKFVDTGANNAQQLVVMNRMLMNKTNKDLETINMEIVDGLIKNTLDEVARVRDLKIKISQLSQEDIKMANDLLDAGDYEALDNFLNKE